LTDDHVKLRQSVQFISEKISIAPKIGVILGSGLGIFANQLDAIVRLPYYEIPHFPKATVVGHEGLLIVGKLGSVDLIVMQGRIHSYEGYSQGEVSYPVRILAELGLTSLIITNAAGGINPNFKPGDFMIITDHINYSFNNPLIGMNPEHESERFLDLNQAYYPPYSKLAKQISEQLNIPVHQGTLLMTPGPTYETAAEIRMMRTLGADAVTMSTVPEVIVAIQKKMKVLGISCITNMGTGLASEKLNHQEVTTTADKISQKFNLFLNTLITTIAYTC
jgi:purine-nucleoside phosphorylase